ncbi:hypothetical protein ES703_84555 [subsurface metagenome]
MHRLVLKIPPYIFVDHINHNGLDNRKANLRPATRAQNGQNRVKFKNRIYGSKFKGVTWNRKYKNWQVQIQVNGKLTFLGRFTDEITAAKAYDRAAKKYHGDFASLNFPQPKRSLYYRVLSLLRALLNHLAYFSSRFPYRSPRLAVVGTATQPLSPHVFGGDQLRHSTFFIRYSHFPHLP